MDLHCPSLKAVLDLVVVSVGSNMVVTFQILPYGLSSFEQTDPLLQRHSKPDCVIVESKSSCSLASPFEDMQLNFSYIYLFKLSVMT